VKFMRTSYLIFLKELREGFRDPKTILLNYLLPLILYPVLTIWGVEMAAVRIERERSVALSVLVSGKVSEDLRGRISKEKNITLKSLNEELRGKLENAGLNKFLSDVAPASKAESIGALDLEAKTKFRNFLRSEELSILLHCGVRSSTGEKSSGEICSIVYDASDWRSEKAKQSVYDKLESQKRNLYEARMKELGLTSNMLSSLSIGSVNTAEVVRVANSKMGDIVPFLVMTILFLTAIYPALNSTVGERERGTLATLLTLPIFPAQLVTGKTFSVLFFCLAGLTSYLLPPVLFTLVLVLTKGEAGFGALGSYYSPANSPWLLPLILIPAAVLISAMSVCVGFFARKLSEAQGYFSFLLLTPALPLMASASGDLQFDAVTALIPILNIALALKSLVVDPVSLVFVFEMAAANLAAAAFFVGLSVHTIRSEYRGDTALSDIVTLNRKVVRRLSPAFSVLLFTLVMGCVLYANVALQKAPIFALLVFTHIFVMVGGPLAALKYFRISLIDSFNIRAPSKMALAAATLAGICTPLVLMCFLPQFEVPKELSEAMAKRMFPEGGSAFFAFICIALIPAVAEELLFRGPILQGLLRGFPRGWAVLISAFLFGIMHMSALRLPATFLIGIVLGIAVVQSRSVFVGMLIHVLNNGLVVLLVKLAPTMGIKEGENFQVPLIYGLLAFAGLALAVGMFFRDARLLAPNVIPLRDVHEKAA